MIIPQRIALSTTAALAVIVLCVVFYKDLLYSNLFDLHASCYRWIPSLIVLHVSSDFLTGLSYVFISVTLFVFVFRLRVPFQYIFLCFGAFIIFCGITHFIEIITTIWVPIYWLSGYIKAITALASVGTALALPPLLPQVRTLITSSQTASAKGREVERLYAEVATNYFALANAMPLLVWTADAKGRSQFYNDAWCTYTGLTQAELIASGWQEVVFHHDEYLATSDLWRIALRDKAPFETEIHIMERWHLLRGIPIIKGECVTGWISTATDISTQKQNERTLRESQERQDVFLSMTSHELKTPLTSMLLVVEFLKHGDSLEKYRLHITILDRQLRRLTALVNDLLDMSRIQSNNLALNMSRVDMRELAQDALQTVQYGVKSHDIVLSCQDGLTTITGDKERIEQVLVNLLTNAIKYSPHAKRVEVSIYGDAENVVCSVRDFGIGISKEAQAHVFERYYRSIGPDSNKYAGLGIGLYIASEIVKRHNGRIQVESEDGKGSTFSFSLPIVQTVYCT